MQKDQSKQLVQQGRAKEGNKSNYFEDRGNRAVEVKGSQKKVD